MMKRNEFEVRDPNESIPFVNLLSAEASRTSKWGFSKLQEKMYKVLISQLAKAQSLNF